MNALPLTLNSARVAAVLALLSSVPVFAGDGAPTSGQSFKLPPETQRDMGSGYERRMDEMLRVFSDPNSNAKVFKFDLDADINKDGVINEYDNGWLEYTPPGMVLKVGETTQVRVSLASHYPYYPGHAVARLSVAGINRAVPTGDFASLEDEIKNSGHIVVYTDASKKHKLLDSADPSKRVVEWTINPGFLLPGHSGIPTSVYVEGTRASGQFPGDIRLMAQISPLPPGPGEKTYKFRSVEDHILFTVNK